MKPTDSPTRRGFVVTVHLPQVGGRRLVAAATLAATGAALWISGAAQLAAPHAMPLHIAVGIGVPGGAGWVTLLLMERRIRRDDVRVPQPQRQERVAAR